MTVDTGQTPPRPSVEKAVAAEWRRRRRVSLIYVALLALPVAAAVYAVLYGLSQQAAVAQEVLPEVTSRVAQDLDQRVDSRVRAEAPAVVRSEFQAQVQPSLARFAEQQTNLSSSVAAVQTDAAEFRKITAEVPQLRADVTSAVGQINGELTAVRQDVAAFRAYEPDLKRLPKLFSDVDAQTGGLSTRLSGVDATVQRLNDRVSKLEALGRTIQNLSDRVAKLEAANRRTPPQTPR